MYLVFDFLSKRTVIKKEGRKNIIETESSFLQAFPPLSSLSETKNRIKAFF